MSIYWQDMIKKIIQNTVKIAYLWAKFSPRRRRAMKKWTTVVWKEIFCRFRISNQIFHTIYGSRDIERSLNTTFAVFGENANFMDEYLKNGGSYGPAVFCKCFVTISSTILELFSKIVRAVFEKIAKNPSKMDVSVLYGWTGFFSKNPKTLFS